MIPEAEPKAGSHLQGDGKVAASIDAGNPLSISANGKLRNETS